MLHKKQLGKGCFNFNIKKYDIGHLQFNMCPGNYYDSYVNYLWQLFTHYQNNLLPYKGSLGNQPAKIIQIFDIIQGLVSEYEEKLRKINKLKERANQRLGNGR